jgi:serine O-acetyltransferase
VFDNLRQDVRRLGDKRYTRIKRFLLGPSAWAIAGYRFRRWVHTSNMPRPIRWLMRIPIVLVDLFAKITSNVEIPQSADIGPGLHIPHAGYVIVSSRAVIGRHCTLTQGVTIGHARGGSANREGAPVIGNRVYVGPGAAVIGPITVGDDALIGVGAVVTRSVPPRGVVAGNPARLLSSRGAFALVAYPGMDDDDERRASLEEQDRDPVRGSSETPPPNSSDDAEYPRPPRAAGSPARQGAGR